LQTGIRRIGIDASFSVAILLQACSPFVLRNGAEAI
jgi:hypothetical protein